MLFLKLYFLVCWFSDTCYGTTGYQTYGSLFRNYQLLMLQCSSVTIVNRFSFLSGFYRKIYFQKVLLHIFINRIHNLLYFSISTFVSHSILLDLFICIFWRCCLSKKDLPNMRKALYSFMDYDNFMFTFYFSGFLLKDY